MDDEPPEAEQSDGKKQQARRPTPQREVRRSQPHAVNGVPSVSHSRARPSRQGEDGMTGPFEFLRQLSNRHRDAPDTFVEGRNDQYGGFRRDVLASTTHSRASASISDTQPVVLRSQVAPYAGRTTARSFRGSHGRRTSANPWPADFGVETAHRGGDRSRLRGVARGEWRASR